jgi:hypothetical protein
VLDFLTVERSPHELARHFEEALAEMGDYFVGSSPLQTAAAEMAKRLSDLGIDYAIAGALCLAAHGVTRATEDIDVLISREGLTRFKDAWLGRGYVDIRPGGKGVRDTVNGVKVDFLIAGDFPGDGKPKPVSFPDPATAAVDAGRFKVVALPQLIELKLASGMTAPHRLQDLADVLRLIESDKLPRELADSLNPYVGAKYLELWQSAQHPEDDY